MKQVAAAVVVLAVLVAVVAFVLLRGNEEAATTLAPEDVAQQTMAADATGEAAGDNAPAVGTGGDADQNDEPLPHFDVVRVEPSGDAVMAGRALPGADVRVMTKEGAIAVTTADESGEWVVVLETPLAPGDHEIWLETVAPGGDAAASSEAVVMSVPETAVAAVDDEAESDEEAAQAVGTLAVTVPRDGDGGIAVLQAPGGGVGISGGGALTLDSLSYDETGNVTLSGMAEPGAELRPYVDGELAGRTTADGDGNWSVTLDREIPQGVHELRVDQVDAEGTVSARLQTPFQQASFTMPSVAEPLVVIQPGNNLWVIARHVYGRGVMFTQIFEANRDQIADPDLIFPGQIFVLPDPASAGG